MVRSRSERTSFGTIQARAPIALVEAVDAYAEGYEVSFSEATRRLLVAGLESIGFRHTVTDASGTYEDDSWRDAGAPPPST